MSLPPPPTAWGGIQDEDMDDLSPGGALPRGANPSTPAGLLSIPNPAGAPTPWSGATNPLYFSPQLPNSGGSRHRANPAFLSPVAGQGHTPTMAEPQGDLQMDDAFGEQVQVLLEGGDAVQIMESMEALCRDQAAQLRHEAAAQLHRAVRHMRLRAEADALEAEAATWCLLRHLTVPGPVAHSGPALSGVGKALTLRQRAADLVQELPDFDVMARVVAWLETLAGQALDNEEAASGRAAYSGRFAAEEALWIETRNKIVRGGSGSTALVRHLDPDAPTREWRHLDGDNAKMQEHLMAHCWRLVRAGRIKAAMQLCREVGEPYRTPSWGCSTLTGMVSAFPGPDAAYSEEEQLSALAVEQEMGSTLTHALGRLAAFQASEQMAEAVNKTGGGCGGGVYEAAIYAVFCGHTAGMLKACKSWQDHCWAYFRSSLDVSLDRQLSATSPTPLSAWREDTATAVQLPGAEAAAARRSEPAALAAGQVGAVLEGRWPLEAVTRGAPKSIDDCLASLQASSPPAADDIHVFTQTQLILAAASQEEGSPYGDLLDYLRAQVQECVAQLQQRREGPGGAAGAVAAAAGRPEAMAAEEHLIRFAAHMALVLEHLDNFELGPGELPPDDAFSAQGNARNVLVECYIVQLMEARQDKLVPLYASKLRPRRREKVYGIYLYNLEPDTLEDCAAVFEISRDCFRLHGVVGEGGQDEMHRLAAAFAAEARLSLEGGPEQRVSATRWLTFSDEMAGTALQHINTVSLGLLLGCGAPLAAGLALPLLSEMLPPALAPGGGVLQELTCRAASRDPMQGTEAEPSMNDIAELSYWQQFYEAERLAQDWDATFGQPLQSGAPGIDKDKAAASARSAAGFIAEVIEAGWMRDVSWDGAVVTEDLVELRVVPSALCTPDKSAFALMDTEVASQLSRELAALWEQELRPWMQAELGQKEAAAFLSVEQDHLGGDSSRSVVVLCLELQSISGASLASPAVTKVVGKMLAALLKGAAPSNPRSDLSGLPLLALSIQASQPISAALARHMAVPRLLLHAARLRSEAAKLQGSLEQLPDVASLVAEPQETLHNFFTVGELQELLQHEEIAAVAAGPGGSLVAV